MRKLISAKDVEIAQEEGKKIIYTDNNTIITPYAKDMAISYGIEFSEAIPAYESKATCSTVAEATKTCTDIDSETIYKVLKAMMDQGFLNGLLDSIMNTKPYISESAANGFKVVRGNSVKLDVFNTGNTDAKVHYQELIGKDESSMTAGLLTIDHSKFDWELSCEEIYYVIEGSLTATIDEKTLTAHAGDVVYAPLGSKVTLGSPNKVKVFYVTYPAN